mgnify:CR=1 FL=1
MRALIAARNGDANPANDVTTIGFRRRQNDVFDRSNVNDRDTWRVVVSMHLAETREQARARHEHERGRDLRGEERVAHAARAAADGFVERIDR